jgi:DHA1 family arabinose polymer transporter-like MFS transporter
MNITASNKKALFALAMGGFGIGLTEFVIMGILPDVADGLGISIPEAGHFIAAYALGVVVGAPLLTAIGGRWPSHRVLAYLMIWFTVFNSLSAFANDYYSLLALRFLSGLPHGAFFGIGAVVAKKLASEGKAAGAIAVMFGGLTIANVIGVPIGTYLGHHFSWHMSFVMVGVIGLMTLASILRWMPELPRSSTHGFSKDLKVFRRPQLWAMIALTTIGTGGFFAWYSYIAPLMTDVAGWPEDMVGYAMILAGLGMVAGNYLGAKMAEKFVPLRAVAISLALMIAALLTNMMVAFNPYAVMAMTFIIGAVAFTVATPIQMAIINTSKGAESLGSSMNQSAFNMGNASGAFLAGLPIAYGYGITSASIVGAVMAATGVLIALGLLWARKQATARKRRLAFQ